MLYRWTRDLHLYLGLFVSPFVVAFSVSVLFLNHAKVDTTAATSVSTVQNVRIPAAIETARGREAVARSREIVEEVGVTGEIDLALARLLFGSHSAAAQAPARADHLRGTVTAVTATTITIRATDNETRTLTSTQRR